MNAWPRIARIVGSLLVTGFALAFLLSADVRFVLRAAWEEGRILLRRQSLTELVADPDTPELRRAQFELVLEARAFAADSLGLASNETYTAYTDVGRDTLLLVLTASPRDRFAAYTWRYPIVGTVPYKGYFDFEVARAKTRSLDERGFDTHLRPAGAFSTLGWFNDPLLSTALGREPVLLATLVFHEIAHNTLYVPGETPFDESFALWVGYRGAEAFFNSRGETVAAERAAAVWRDQLRLGDFYRDLLDELEALYGSELSSEAKIEQREAVFDSARARLRGPLGQELEAYSGDRLAEGPLNNANLLGQRIYRSSLGLFDQLLEREGGDVRRAVAVLKEAVEESEDETPFEVLERLVAE